MLRILTYAGQTSPTDIQLQPAAQVTTVIPVEIRLFSGQDPSTDIALDASALPALAEIGDEYTGAADSTSFSVFMPVDVTETANAADNADAEIAYLVLVIEAATAQDDVSEIAEEGGNIAEQVQALDAVSAVQIFFVAHSETADASDYAAGSTSIQILSLPASRIDSSGMALPVSRIDSSGITVPASRIDTGNITLR